jgi:predicted amidophosphoribosyltransferase
MEKENKCIGCGRRIDRRKGYCLSCEKRLVSLEKRIAKARQARRSTQPGR